MPNHMHGLVELKRGPADAKPPALGDVVGAYKSAVSRIIGRRERGRQLPARPGAIAAGESAIWHRNYWDVIVRGERALANNRHYIRINPRNYDAVMNPGQPRFLGDMALFDLPKVGFLASRGQPSPHGWLPVKRCEALFSGFLSPMERAVFRAGLKCGRAMIWVKPWGLREGTDEPAIGHAIEKGQLLVVSPFDAQLDAPSIRRAVWCNHYILAHCDRAVVGHLDPDGMLAWILSEANPETDLTYL